MHRSFDKYSDIRELLIIPVESGKGFTLTSYISNYDQLEFWIYYGNCECKDGMFNGALFSKKEVSIDGSGYSQITEREGFVKNGLADGKYICREWTDPGFGGVNTSYCEYGNVFANGTPTVLEEAENGFTGFVCYWRTQDYDWVNGKKVERSGSNYSELMQYNIFTYSGPEIHLFRLAPDGTIYPDYYYKNENGDVSAYPW